MKEQFVPYELAVKLKELGFDLKCLAYYVIGEFEDEPLPMGTVCGPGYGDIHFGVFIPKYQYAADDKLVAAPLWQQAFDFIRNKYQFDSFQRVLDKAGKSYWKISKLYDDGNIKGFAEFSDTIQEARLGCLKKLIELANEKKAKIQNT